MVGSAQDRATAAYSRRRFAKTGTVAVSAKVTSATTTLLAGPAIGGAGRDATRSRALAVAVTALATLLLNAAGVTGARVPAVPLSADRRADRSRIRFKLGSLIVMREAHIGANTRNVHAKPSSWPLGQRLILTDRVIVILAGTGRRSRHGFTGAGLGCADGGGAISSFHRTDELHWLAVGLFFLSRGGVKRPLAIIRLHVVSSSNGDSDEVVTLQSDTVPVSSIVSLNVTRPSSAEALAAGG